MPGKSTFYYLIATWYHYVQGLYFDIYNASSLSIMPQICSVLFFITQTHINIAGLPGN